MGGRRTSGYGPRLCATRPPSDSVSAKRIADRSAGRTHRMVAAGPTISGHSHQPFRLSQPTRQCQFNRGGIEPAHARNIRLADPDRLSLITKSRYEQRELRLAVRDEFDADVVTHAPYFVWANIWGLPHQYPASGFRLEPLVHKADRGLGFVKNFTLWIRRWSISPLRSAARVSHAPSGMHHRRVGNRDIHRGDLRRHYMRRKYQSRPQMRCTVHRCSACLTCCR